MEYFHIQSTFDTDLAISQLAVDVRIDRRGQGAKKRHIHWGHIEAGIGWQCGVFPGLLGKLHFEQSSSSEGMEHRLLLKWESGYRPHVRKGRSPKKLRETLDRRHNGNLVAHMKERQKGMLEGQGSKGMSLRGRKMAVMITDPESQEQEPA